MNLYFLENPHLLEYYGIVLVLLLLYWVISLAKNSGIVRSVLAGILILAPIAYFYILLDAHTVNIPFKDDFNVMETVQKFRQASNFTERAQFLFKQVNQHRFAFERVVLLMMILFTGAINVKLQILFGNLFMLGIMFLFFQILRKENVSWHYFLPVPFILFNLIYYENANWGIAALQNTPLIFFALLTFYGLNRGDTSGWIVGLLSAIVVTFVSGTGMLAFIIGALLLLLQRRFYLFGIWTLVAVGVVLFYFLFDYTFIESESSNVLSHPIYNGLLMLGFWGNALYMDFYHTPITSFYPDMLACVALGLAIGLIFLLWALRFFIITPKNQGSYWLLLGAFLFVMGTGAMFALSRPLSTYFMFGGNIFSRRYMIFGVVLLAVAYLALIILTRKIPLLQKSVMVLSMVGFVGLNFLSYFTSIVQLRKQREDLLLNAYYWKNYSTFLTIGGDINKMPFWNHPTRMKELVSLLEASGISNFYDSDRFPEASLLLEKTASNTEFFPGSIDASVEYRFNDQNLLTEYLHFYATINSGKDPRYFLLASPQYKILLPAIPVVNNWKNLMRTHSYYNSIYHYGLFRPKIPTGLYQLWMVTASAKSNRRWESYNTRQAVRLTDKKMPITDPTHREFSIPELKLNGHSFSGY